MAEASPWPGLIYSVCTFTQAEGPAQIAALVERDRAAAGLRAPYLAPPEADAFYIARLDRS